MKGMFFMTAQKTIEKYYIFILDPKGCMVVGQDGIYENTISKAISFFDKYDALKYVEKHGLQKISTIRKCRYK